MFGSINIDFGCEAVRLHSLVKNKESLRGTEMTPFERIREHSRLQDNDGFMTRRLTMQVS